MQREQFKECLTHILKYHEELNKWCDTLGSDLFTCPIFEQANYIIDKLVDYIGLDNDELIDLINWWLYEDVKKVLRCKDKEISVKTIDELYNYIN